MKPTHEETRGQKRRFDGICAYLLEHCITDRPLSDEEIMSAWKQAKKYDIDDLLDQADLERKKRRDEGEL